MPSKDDYQLIHKISLRDWGLEVVTSAFLFSYDFSGLALVLYTQF